MLTIEEQRRIREQIERQEAKQFCVDLATNSAISPKDFPYMVEKIADLFAIINRQTQTIKELQLKIESLDDTDIVERDGTDIEIARRTRSGPSDCKQD